MIFLGIDPGTRRIGYGFINVEKGVFQLVDAGIFPIASDNHLGAIREACIGVDRAIKKFKPSVVALERIFFAKNRKTGIQVAEMRGVLLSSILAHRLPVEEYSPNEVKSSLTGYGLADKKAVLKMVRLLLGEPSLTIIDDASDALAIALVAAMRNRSY